MTDAADTLYIIAGGTGDTGRRLARLLLDERDATVWLTSRDADAEVDIDDVPVRQWDGAGAADGFSDLLDKAHEAGYRRLVVYNVIGAWLRQPRGGILGVVEALVDAMPGPFEHARLVHCSATSVYGDRPGEVLDETSALSPAFEVGRVHAEAEQYLLGAERGFEAVVLRVPHIYGPRRERTIDLMAAGEMVVAGDGQNPMHHIHIEDLVRALEAAGRADVDGLIINVVDDDPLTYGEYCDFVADWYGEAPLQRVSLEQAIEHGTLADILGPVFGRRKVLEEFYKYMTSSATISNARMKQQLGLELRYPTFREGLTQLLEQRDRRLNQA